MITSNYQVDGDIYSYADKFFCDSHDDKPSNADARDGLINGAILEETDTGKTYIFDKKANQWTEKAAGGGGDGGGGSTTLVGLTDVDISNPSNGQTLVYNSTSGKWENGSGIRLVHKNTNWDTRISVLDATFAEIYDAIAAGQSPVIAYVDEESDPAYPYSQIEQVAAIGVDGDELQFATFSLVDRDIVEYRVATVNSYPETGGQTEYPRAKHRAERRREVEDR